MSGPETGPIGRYEVMAALKAATLDLLAAQGTQFSVRDVAQKAQVNHGLVHRHFGSKADLISAASADLAADLKVQLHEGVPPLDLVGAKRSATSRILAHLILENQAHLVTDHPALAALVEQAKDNPGASPLSPEERAALTTALSLGWAVFGEYVLAAAGAQGSERVARELSIIIEGLMGTR